MPLTILTDQDVRQLLDTLTKDDVLAFHKVLVDALHSYSTAEDSADSKCCASNQPARVVIKQRDGSTALFMPATSDKALGVKVLNVSESTRASETVADVESLKLSDGNGSSTSARGSISEESFGPPSRTSTTSTAASTQTGSSNRPSTSSTLGSVSSATGQKWPKYADDSGDDVGLVAASPTSPKGSLTLLDLTGRPRALINASTLTAFRTALASTLILKQRQNVHTLTVFGAGLQAYWHIYLSLLLRRGELHHINIINRDFKRAQRLLVTLAYSSNDAISDAYLSQKLKPSILTPEFNDYARILKEHVRNADVIYCCTPSTKPLFPAAHLCATEGRKKARYIAAIGSYKPHMQELHEDILKQAVRGPEETHSHIHLHHRHAHEGGAVIVDSIEGAMKEAGEIIKAGISGQGIVEIGEIVMLKRSYWAEKAAKEALEHTKREEENVKEHQHGGHGLGHLFHHHAKKEKVEPADGGLQGWLEKGNVIYKSVGLGLMDVVVGMKLVELAEERGFGTRIDDF